MDKHLTEIFGEFTYSQSLSYEDLLECEKYLLENLDNIYLDGGADHLDFTPLGDLLMLQCAFESRNLEILRDIADEIAAIMPLGVKGRILCLEKNLVSYHMFWIQRGSWTEKEYIISKTGPEDAPVHMVNPFEPESAPEEEDPAVEKPDNEMDGTSILPE